MYDPLKLINHPFSLRNVTISPSSSRHSSSPTRATTSPSNSQKINSTTLDLSNSEQSDSDEDIDVVKSAFQPIGQPIQPDSTVEDAKESPTKCELKAVSSMKAKLSSLYSKQETISNTKLPSPTAKITAEKRVWRPY